MVLENLSCISFSLRADVLPGHTTASKARLHIWSRLRRSTNRTSLGWHSTPIAGRFWHRRVSLGIWCPEGRNLRFAAFEPDQLKAFDLAEIAGWFKQSSDRIYCHKRAGRGL